MTREDHFLLILAEECAEIAQRVTKAMRFSLRETQPGQNYTNAERIMHEYADLIGAMEKLLEEGTLSFPSDFPDRIETKKNRIEEFLKISERYGRLDQ